MSITQVQANTFGTAGASSPVTVTLGAGITLGNLLTVTLNYGDSSGSLTITPPDGSWVKAIQHQSTAGSVVAIYYLVVDAGHAGQTSWSFSFNNAHNGNLTAAEWNSTTGWPASALTDQTATNGGTSSTADSGTTSATTQASELWLAGLATNGTVTFSGVTSGWSSSSHNSAANSLLSCWQPVTSTGTADVSATLSSSIAWGGAVATLKSALTAGPSGSAPGGTVTPRPPSRRSRLVTGHVTGPANASAALGPAGSPPGGCIVRRVPVGGTWGGLTSSRTGSAAPGAPGSRPGGTVAQRPPSRRPRASTAHVTSPGNATSALGPAGNPPGGCIVRRVPVGGTWGGQGTLHAPVVVLGPAGSPPGGLVRRRQSARVVTARILGLINAPPRPPGSPPGGLVTRRQSGGIVWGGLASSQILVVVPFAVARSTATVTDPRDGTSTVTAAVTSTATVTDPRDGTAGVT